MAGKSISAVGSSNDLPPIRTLASWIVAAAQDKPYKHLITYPELWSILQIDPQSHRGRSAILKAQRILLDDHNKFLACVNGKGYEIAHPSEHAEYVKRLRRASIRKLRKAQRVSVHVDITGLSPEEMKTLTLEQTKTGVQLAFVRRIESKRKIENVIERAGMKPRAIAKAITGTE